MRILGQGSETFASGAVDGVTTTLQRIYSIADVIWWSLHLEVTGATLAGNWTVEADNRWSPDPGYQGQPKNAGAWALMATTLFTPNIQAVAAGPTNGVQLVVPTVCAPFRALRVTFTRTAGSGNAFIALQGKG